MLQTTMLDYLRIVLYVMLGVIGLMLYQAWETEHPPAKIAAPLMSPASNEAATRYVPVAAPAAATSASGALSATSNDGTVTSLPPPATGQLINVKTDLFDAQIDTLGGDLVSTKLLAYPESLHSKTPFVLLNDNPEKRYIAESGLLSAQGPDTPQGQSLFQTDNTNYVLAPGQNTLEVPLHWQKDGLKVTKIYTFSRDSYVVHVRYQITNESDTPWRGRFYAQLARTDTPPENHGGLVNLTTYFGAAISSPEKRFNKISFKDIREQPLNQQIQGGWTAMIQHYFISAWVPNPNLAATYYSNVTPSGLYTIGLMEPEMVVSPKSSAETSAKLYTGPAIPDEMETVAPGLKLTIDYGIFWFISGLIFWMMQKIHEVIGNWGWSIVLVTIIIKLLFYHLSAKSYRSMSSLKKLQPRIELLKERYGDDRQKLTQGTLELYKQEKVNPMSGCLPILIQIPVFIALYWVLVESVELRQAPFMLWIRDLSQPDPYYVLPVLMGISMFLQQRLNPPPPDPTQAKIMMLMPVIFTVLFANFPSGLMLYWFVNNSLSFLQQWYIMHSMEKENSKKKA